MHTYTISVDDIHNMTFDGCTAGPTIPICVHQPRNGTIDWTWCGPRSFSFPSQVLKESAFSCDFMVSRPDLILTCLCASGIFFRSSTEEGFVEVWSNGCCVHFFWNSYDEQWTKNCLFELGSALYTGTSRDYSVSWKLFWTIVGIPWGNENNLMYFSLLINVWILF